MARSAAADHEARPRRRGGGWAQVVGLLRQRRASGPALAACRLTSPCAQPLEDGLRNRPDVAGAHDEDEVARLGGSYDALDGLVRAQDGGVRMVHDLREGAYRWIVLVCLPSRGTVRRREDNVVSIAEAPGERVEEAHGAVRGVRLEDRPDWRPIVGSCGGEGGPDCRGVVCVVIDDRDAGGDSDQLEASARAAK